MMVKGYSITGTKHIGNQDGFFIREESGKPYMYITADGMGGHAAGDVAAKTAIDTIKEKLTDFSAKAITEAVNDANINIFAKAKSSPELEGMGTTVVLCMRKGNKIIIAHVGDSRAYICRNGALTISAQEAKAHPMKNIITNAVGVQENVNVDIAELEVNENSVITLCSDGVSNVMTDERLAEISSDCSDDPAKTLCEEAQKLGSSDDVTAIVINLRGDIL